MSKPEAWQLEAAIVGLRNMLEHADHWDMQIDNGVTTVWEPMPWISPGDAPIRKPNGTMTITIRINGGARDLAERGVRQ